MLIMQCPLMFMVVLCCAASASAQNGKNVAPSKSKEFADVENNVGMEETSKGEKLTEGDMIFPKKDNGEGSDRNAKVAGENEKNRWPTSDGIVKVPFVFTDELTKKAKMQFMEAAEDYASWTCILFVPRTIEKDYIEVISDKGCYSHVGRTGGSQPLSLGKGCDDVKGIPAHEMMHALGFSHEQSRPDRDQYITVLKDNIRPDMFYNFKVCTDCTIPGDLPYDYKSLMHYSVTSFSTNGEKTLIPKKSVETRIGQRIGLCDMDIKKLNWMYKCGGKTVLSKKPNGGVIPCEVEQDQWYGCWKLAHECDGPQATERTKTNCAFTCARKKLGLTLH